ncbi:transcription initiation factor TFIID subunit 4-like isoform X2 [Anolis carolinensis]
MGKRGRSRGGGRGRGGGRSRPGGGHEAPGRAGPGTQGSLLLALPLLLPPLSPSLPRSPPSAASSGAWRAAPRSRSRGAPRLLLRRKVREGPRVGGSGGGACPAECLTPRPFAWQEVEGAPPGPPAGARRPSPRGSAGPSRRVSERASERARERERERESGAQAGAWTATSEQACSQDFAPGGAGILVGGGGAESERERVYPSKPFASLSQYPHSYGIIYGAWGSDHDMNKHNSLNNKCKAFSRTTLRISGGGGRSPSSPPPWLHACLRGCPCSSKGLLPPAAFQRGPYPEASARAKLAQEAGLPLPAVTVSRPPPPPPPGPWASTAPPPLTPLLPPGLVLQPEGSTAEGSPGRPGPRGPR